MKITVTIIVLIALGLQVQAGKLGRQLKESVCTNKDGVMVAMPGSCTGFFFCIHGNAIASSCGSFYHFNSRLAICDHPERALCELDKPKVKNEAESDQEAEEICQRTHVPNLVLGKSKSCSQFYVCHEKRALKRVCPPQKHFNLKSKVCQDIELAQCVYAKPLELSSPTNKPSTNHSLKKRNVPANFCSRSKQNGMMPHPWDCGLFVYCIDDRPEVMTCPRGLHFSIQRQRCEWPSIAKCVENLSM